MEYHNILTLLSSYPQDVGSTAMMPTDLLFSTNVAQSLSTNVDLPAPGGPVIPIESALPVLGYSSARI